MTKKLELSEMDFKGANKTMPLWAMMGMLESNGKNSLGKDRKNIMKNEMKILEFKSKITKKKIIDELNSQIKQKEPSVNSKIEQKLSNQNNRETTD